jgi:hypothetical protein
MPAAGNMATMEVIDWSTILNPGRRKDQNFTARSP